MKTYFVNEAFEKAVNDYLLSKDKESSVLYNSFLVVVIRMLINIYGELDIINPFQIKSETALDSNLSKFGFTKAQIDDFKRLIDGFYRIEKKNMTSIKKETNIYFIEVQKKLIDMFDLKRLSFGITDSEQKEFFDLLYTPGTSNALRLSYNFLNAENIYEIAEYYKTVMEKKIVEEKEKKNLLSFETYKMFGIGIADLSKMNEVEVDSLNSEIYKSLDISENAINKDYLLEEKIKAFRMQNNKVTTGNGYVDILLIMSVIVTTIMIVVIFGTLVF